MGNGHSGLQQQEFTPNELRGLLAKDNQWYRHADEEHLLFDDDFVSTKFLHELESCTHTYKDEDKLLQKRLNSYEKGLNLMLSLAVMDNPDFQEKETRWLKREIEALTQTPPNAFTSLLDKRLALLRAYYLALVRADQRRQYRKHIPPPPAPPPTAGSSGSVEHQAAAPNRVDLTSLLRQRVRQRQALRRTQAAAAAAATDEPAAPQQAGQQQPEGEEEGSAPDLVASGERPAASTDDPLLASVFLDDSLSSVAPRASSQDAQDEGQPRGAENAPLGSSSSSSSEITSPGEDTSAKGDDLDAQAKSEEGEAATRPKRSAKEAFLWDLFQGTLDEPLLEQVLASLGELPPVERLVYTQHHDNDFDWNLAHQPPPGPANALEEAAAPAGGDRGLGEGAAPEGKQQQQEQEQEEEESYRGVDLKEGGLLRHLLRHLARVEEEALLDIVRAEERLHAPKQAKASSLFLGDDDNQKNEEERVTAPQVDIATTTSTSSSTASPTTPQCRPAVRVVQLLQRELFKEAAFAQYRQHRVAQQNASRAEEREQARQAAHAAVRQVGLYAELVLHHAMQLLDAAWQANARLASIRAEAREREMQKALLLPDKDSPQDDKTDHANDREEGQGHGKAATDPQSSLRQPQNNQAPSSAPTTTAVEEEEETGLDARLRDALAQGPVLSHIVRPLATVLCLFLDDDTASSGARQRHFSADHLSTSLLPLLVRLLKALDAINGRAEDSLGREQDYQAREQARLRFKTLDRKKVETPHNYYPNTDEEKVVRIPGATHLCVTFDERCSLEKDRDFLQLYRRPGKQQPIFTAFTGASQAWPRVPIIVAGDTVCFHFTSDPFNTYWGYRCIVTGLVLESSYVPLWDLERTVSSLVGRCLRNLLVGPAVGATETALAKWLDSPLFEGGLLLHHAPPEQQEEEKEKVASSDEAQTLLPPSPVEAELAAADEELAWLFGGLTGSGASPDDSAGYRYVFAQKNRALPDLFDRFGGDAIDDTLRWFVAVALRHLGLVAVARKPERAPAEEKQLDAVWREAKSLRRWIVQEKQRVANEASERPPESQEVTAAAAASLSSSSSGSGATVVVGISATVAGPTVDRTTYEYYRDTLIGKLRVLLRARPAAASSSASSSAAAAPLLSALADYAKHASEATSLEMTLLRREKRAHGRATALETLRDLLRSLALLSAKQDLLRLAASAWRHVEDVAASATSAQQQAAAGATPPPPPAVPASGPEGSRRRRRTHYLSNTGAVGQATRARLHKSFVALYQDLTRLLAAPGTDLVTSGLILGLWCLHFARPDHAFLMETGILELCHGLMTASGLSPPETSKARRRLRVLGRLAFRFLAIQCLTDCRPLAQHDDEEEASTLTPAQSYLLETVVRDLERSIAFLHQKRQDLGRVMSSGDIGASEEGDITPDTVAYHKEEKFCYAQLVLFNTVTQGAAHDGFLASSRILRLLLFIHFAGTPELQRLTLRMLRRILPLVDPALFDGAPELLNFEAHHHQNDGSLIPFGMACDDDDGDDNEGEETLLPPPSSASASPRGSAGTGEPMNALVKHFFELLGQRLFLDGGEKTGTLRHRLTASHSASFAHNFRDGQVAFMESEEVLMLLRSLVEGPASARWSALVTHAARRALLTLPALIDADRFALAPALYRRPRPVYHALSALCLLGGCVEGLRVGGRIEVTSTRELGTLVFYDRRSSLAKLILDSAPHKIIDVDPGKIRAHPEFQINPDRLLLTGDLLEALIIFAQVSDKRDQVRLRERAERERREREEREAREHREQEEREQRAREEAAAAAAAAAAAPAEWTCEVCTLINEIAEPFCQACGSARPADAVPAVPPVTAVAKRAPMAEAEAPNTTKGDRATLGEDTEGEAEEQLIHAEEDVLFYQLRSRATKALCKLMAHPANAVLVAKQGALSTLLSIAVRPTELEGFKSLEQLETRQDRLLELLYQHGVGMDREEVGPQQLSQAELLEHNPFKGQPVNLPSAFDRSTARAVGFLGGQLRTVVGRADPTSLVEGVGIARANFAIPNSLPAFYFEVRLLKDEAFKGSIEAQLIADESEDADDNADNDADDNDAQAEKEEVPRGASSSSPGEPSAAASSSSTSSSSLVAVTEKEESNPAVVPQAHHHHNDDGQAASYEAREGQAGRRRRGDRPPSRGPRGLNIGVGLYREGIPLEGTPGEHNSYAYLGSRGSALHNVGNLRVSGIDSRAYGPAFHVGDVIGCGWDIRGKSLYFTHNGQYLGSAFANVSGRFYPVVWIKTNGVKVQANFGQEPFLFEFVSTLPEGYLEGMEHMESKAKVMTIQEIKRRTQAEELMLMMGVFPLELCVVALERSRDDITYAANWLLERGYQELDRWAKDTIAVSKREQEEREMKVLLDAQAQHDRPARRPRASGLRGSGGDEQEEEEEEEDLDEDEHHPAPPGGDVDDEEDDGEEEEDTEDNSAEEEHNGTGGAYSEDYNRDAGRFLDDELGVDTPVQVERRERIVEGMKIEDIVPGIQLRVSPNSTEKYAHIMHTRGRIGVVADTDIDTLRVLLRLANPETASRHYFWFYFYDLEKPEGMYQDPCMDLVSSSTKIRPSAAAPTKSAAWLARLKHHLVKMSNALLILQVRRCVLSLISSWVELDLALLGGPRYLIDLLKLAAAEHLASKAKNPTSGGWVGEMDVLASFRIKLAKLLRAEEGLFPSSAHVPALDLPTYSDKGTARRAALPQGAQVEHAGQQQLDDPRPTTTSSSTVASLVSLTKLVTEECILHFVQAVSVPPPAIVEESAHPYENNQDYRKALHINGASRLIIRFDPRCHINTDMLSRVAFYRDDQYQDPIAIYRGKMGGNQFQPLIVHGDTVYFRFTTGPVATFWGFRFTVTPLEWRLNDQQALHGLNFELGYWLLELLLEEGPSFVRDVYLVDLYDALVWYIRAAKRAAKGRGIQLLLRVLREINASSEASRKVLLQKVLGLRKKMDAIYSKEVTDSRLLHSAHLQSLVELVAVARLVGDEIHRSSSSSSSSGSSVITTDDGSATIMAVPGAGGKGKEKEKEKEEEQEKPEQETAPPASGATMGIEEVGTLRLRIKKAIYGNLDKRRLCRNVTRELQEWVDRVGGGHYLWLPPNHQAALPFLSPPPAAAQTTPSSSSSSSSLSSALAAAAAEEAASSSPAADVALSTSAAAAAAAATTAPPRPAADNDHALLAASSPVPVVAASSPTTTTTTTHISIATPTTPPHHHPTLATTPGGRGISLPSSLSSSSGSAPTVVPPSNKRRLKLWYEIIDGATGTVLEHAWQRTVGAGEQLVLKAEPSWFGTVVSVADQVQSLLKHNGRFSQRLLAQAFRAAKLAASHYALVGADQALALGRGLGLSRPGLGSGLGDVGSWSLALWVYLEEDSTGHMRVLLLRGLDSDQCRQALFVGSDDRRLVVTVSTDHDWRESFTSKAELPLREWTHVVVCCDARRRSAALMINGVSDAEHRLSSPAKFNPHPFYLGHPPDGVLKQQQQQQAAPVGGEGGGGQARGPGEGCAALVRDVRFYTRALSMEEASLLHQHQHQHQHSQSSAPPAAAAADLRALRTWHPSLASSASSSSASPPPPPPGSGGGAPARVPVGEVEGFLGEGSRGWGLETLTQVVELVVGLCDETKQDPLVVDVGSIVLAEEDLDRFPAIRGRNLGPDAIRVRFEAVRLFNRQLAVVLPLVDFSQTHLSWSLAHSVCKLTGLIFPSTKVSLWNKILNSTMSRAHKPSITINRPRALRAKEKGDPEGSRSVFGQAYRQLHFLKPEVLRVAGQTFSVTYEGEGGRDAGGLFRDCISHMCADLHSSWVPLFIPCPNAKGFGENQDKWVPNPLSLNNSLHLSMYAFVGKLMGIAIRGKHILNLDLPSIVWKQLVGAELTLRDLELIDKHCVNQLEELRAMSGHGTDDERMAFEALAYTWATPAADGKTLLDLCPNGRELPVHFDDRFEYARKVQAARLNEFREQVEHIRKGMATIIPIQLLSLFTWQELELNVCGKNQIDIQLLRENTRYQSGFSDEDEHVQMLWRVLDVFTHKQRELFLRFVWGRSRLPLTSADFQQKFVILSCTQNNDMVLPISHTCFFQLELPRYSTDAILREKLLYAITYCRDIDTDFRATPVDWDADE